MGNRANIVFTNGRELSPAIYLHWNDGPESIYAFLDEMERRNIRTDDVMYESARFCHIVGDYFDQEAAGGLSLGLVCPPEAPTGKVTCTAVKRFCKKTDMSNHGLYVIHRKYDSASKRVKVSMERFVESDWNEKTGCKVKRLPKGQVASEEKIARAHEYSSDIATAFKRIRPEISKHG